MAKRLTPERLGQIRDALSVKKVAKIGFFASAKYPDGTPVAYVAAIQEFGYPEGGIPSRSFMRTTIAERKDTWKEKMKKGVQGIIKGNQTVDSVMEGVGLEAAGDMRKKITRINSPKLKESTLAARRRRGNSSKKPLNDTGYMLASLTNSVEAP